MRSTDRYIGAAIAGILLLTTHSGSLMAEGSEVCQPLTDNQELGKAIFCDQRLSLNGNQSCAGCHQPDTGWTGPDSEINAHGAVYEGSVAGLFGNRKPPSSAYASPSPILHPLRQGTEIVFVGGNFWDGRATGEKLGSPVADQAQGPFLNPVEQALPDSACVVYKVCTASSYPTSFEGVWGSGACGITWPGDIETTCSTADGVVALSALDRFRVDLAYDQIAISIADYEGSPEVNRFSSKFDLYIAGVESLNRTERRGLSLFRGKAKCINCHVIGNRKGKPPVFTDFTYANLGIPRNPENPWYTMPSWLNPEGSNWLDKGLGAFLATRVDYQAYAAENYGKHKVPTLRNVDSRPWPGFVKAYGHNGYFKSLKGIVHFYNTRDVKPRCVDPDTTEADALAQGCWPAPEIPVNVNTTELDDLKLTPMEEDAIVAFLKTLSDGYEPESHHGRRSE